MTATKQSGGLPEKHKAHLSRPPIAKNIITIIYNAVQGARCKVQGAKCIRYKCAQFSDTTSYSGNKNTLRLCLKREVGLDWIVFRLSGKLFHKASLVLLLEAQNYNFLNHP